MSGELLNVGFATFPEEKLSPGIEKVFRRDDFLEAMNQLPLHPYTRVPPQSVGKLDLPILQQAADAYKLWHGFLQHFPRLSRFTLGEKIDGLFLATVELILLAGYSAKDQKLTVVRRAATKLDAVKFFLQIAWELKALDNKKYIRLSEPLRQVGRMLGGWRKQLATNETPPE